MSHVVLYALLPEHDMSVLCRKVWSLRTGVQVLHQQKVWDRGKWVGSQVWAINWCDGYIAILLIPVTESK